MSVTGLCQICESREAEFQCGRCGTLACSAHYDEDASLCSNCAAEAGPGRGEGDDDPDTYEF